MKWLQLKIVLLVALVTLVHGSATAVAQDFVSRESELKAGIVVLLGRYVRWPANEAPGNGKPLQIGVLGNDPFQDGNVNHLDQKVRGQNMRVQRFASLDEYQKCHVLVISRDEDVKTVMAKLKGQPVLTIGETPGAAADGAVLNLVVNAARNNIDMELNRVAAREAQLVFPANLVRLTKIVK